jgi:thioredoxin-like negative regulator of GroEL
MILVVVALVAAAGVVQGSPQARIGGTVSGPDGKPLEGAVITITSSEAPAYKKVIETDARGQFKALILDATTSYVMHVEAAGFTPHDEPFKVPVGTTDNDFPITLSTQAQSAAVSQALMLEQPGYKELEEGRKLLTAGDTTAAKAKFEAAVAVLPDLLPGWMALLQIAYDGGDAARALELAEKCLTLDDEAAQCLAIAANAAKDLGKTTEADAYRARFEVLNPEDPTTLFNQAVELLNKLDDSGARPLLEQCLKVDPSYPNCLFQYGMILLRAGDMAGAKQHLERFLAVSPTGEDAAVAAETVKYL